MSRRPIPPTIYRARILHSLDPQRIEVHAPGLLWVDAAGRITRIGPADEVRASERRGWREVDFGDRLLLPGFVDAHLHIPQIDIVGIESEHLIDWLRDHIFEEEAANADPSIARDRAERCFRQLIRHGTTACAAFSSLHTQATEIAFEEAERIGIRAVIGKVLMDRGAPHDLIEPAEPALAATERLHRQWSGRDDGRLDVAVTPRFGVSCTDDLLAGAGALAAQLDARVQTHLSENKDELALIARLFPDRADYTRVYAHHRLLHSRCLVAHCIHVSDDELACLADAGATAVYCPDSNFFLHSGRFPLERALAQGVGVALGTDIGAGTSFSLFETMKMANYMQTTQVDPCLLFYLATLGGARALGWSDRIGNLAPQKEADFVILDPRDMVRERSLTDYSLRELISILIHRGHGAGIEEVFIRGRRVGP